MHIDPLSDVVVIRRQTQQEVSRGGIYLPLSDEFREDIGVVVFAGKGKLSPKGVRIPMEVKAGMKVLFSTNGHQITTVNGEELVVLREPSIIGVIEGDDVHSFSAEQEGS
jgi:chaperonin GroES